MKRLRVLILGTGGMARTHAEAYAAMADVDVVAGVDVQEAAVTAFCDKHGIEHRFTSLDAAIKWGGFDAVSNVTPDQLHHATTIPLLAAGKHVLCEKPLATNYSDAQALADAAKQAGVVNMVNLSYRNVAVMQQAAQLVREGVIGEPRHFEASYLQSWLTQPSWGDWRSEPTWLWRLSSKHGSKGVLGDVGVHILDFVSFVADSMPVDVSCRLKTFAKAPGDQIGAYHLDANDSCAMHLELEGGATGVISASRFASGHHNDLRLRLYGTLGGLEVRFERKTETLKLCVGDDMLSETWRDVAAPAVTSVYQRFVAAVLKGGPSEPSFAHGAALQRVLDCAEGSDAAGGKSVKV
jgi:predicted dehydrogenase